MKISLLLLSCIVFLYASNTAFSSDSAALVEKLTAIEEASLAKIKVAADSLASISDAVIASSGVKTGKSPIAAELLSKQNGVEDAGGDGSKALKKEKMISTQEPKLAKKSRAAVTSGNPTKSTSAVTSSRSSTPSVSERRNPFASPNQGGASRGLLPEGVVVFGQNPNDNVEWGDIPHIQVTGFMSARGKQVACAYVGGLGNTILQEGDRVIIPNVPGGKEKKTDWFMVKQIGENSMTILLADGSMVSGRLF